MSQQHDFTVTIYDTSDRADMWFRIFGNLTVPVQSFIPHCATLPGFDEPQRVYMLKLDAISDEERERLIDEIAQKFNADRETVATVLASDGMPILASDCIITVHNPQRWFGEDDIEYMDHHHHLNDLDEYDDLDDEY
ncbi:MAG: hypothetical protein ACFE0Q_20645 [Anaerolineae bacterium]